MKDLKTKIFESNNDSVTFTLNIDDLDKILFALPFAAGWSMEADVNEYKKLWDELYNVAQKSFDKEEIQGRIPEKWDDYELSHRGSFRRLN